MVFGMIEFGRAIMVQQVLTNAAREGARVAILDSTDVDASDVTNTVNAWLTGAQLPAASATITMNPRPTEQCRVRRPGDRDGANPVQQRELASDAGFIGSSVNLSATTVMRRETIQTTTGS